MEMVLEKIREELQRSKELSAFGTYNINQTNYFNKSVREGKIHCGYPAAIFKRYCFEGKNKTFIINVGVTILNKDVRGRICSPLPVRGLIPRERNENMALRVMTGFPFL